eukprot:30949-Pelagococcus_subviridis.AAC.5
MGTSARVERRLKHRALRLREILQPVSVLAVRAGPARVVRAAVRARARGESVQTRAARARRGPRQRAVRRRLREGDCPYEATSGWSSKASEAELKGIGRASEKSKTSPASSFGLSTNSLSSSYRCTLGGHGRFALWLPRMTQNPPSPGFVGVNATLAARSRLYIFPPSNAYASSSHLRE